MNKETIAAECIYSFSRSGGKGGQHVNKVSTKADVQFFIDSSKGLNEVEKELIKNALTNRMNIQGDIRLSCDTSRSQLKNKELVFNRLIDMLESALIVDKPRKKTHMPASVNRKRLDSKGKRSEIKKFRRRPDSGSAD
jgi:ribosome-associated protein